jgi:predicted nucleic acid-binding protein
MNFMSGRIFIDSNILIYAHDSQAGRRNQVAKSVLQALWDEGIGALSMQVLQEFYVNVTRKIPSPIPKDRARVVVDVYSPWCVETTPAEIFAAFRVEDDAHIGFWDALIVASALKSGAAKILSEDLNPGEKIAGILIENPFYALQ